MPDSLLIIEDERLLGTELQRHYHRKGWDVAHVETLRGAERFLRRGEPEPFVVLSDMNLPDGNALDLLERLRADSRYTCEWIFLTGYGEVPDSVRALRLGAYDFLTKPCEQDRLDLVVAGAVRSAKAQQRLHEASSSQVRRYTSDSFLGRSAAARRVRDILEKIAAVPFSALVISGETGTGKGLAARILHYSGRRAEGPLVEINCAALPRELLESELFGHEQGAFTGAKGRHRGLMEQANTGTLFLDEIGELPADLQAKLLTAIEDRAIRRLGGERLIAVDVQIIAASNRNLEESVAKGAFRADLFHRLSVVQLELPALRERKEDLEDLVPVFVSEYNAKAAKQVRSVPGTAWSAMKQHSWPGNVRELRNVIERCVLFSSGVDLPVDWLQLSASPALEGAPVNVATEGDRLHLPLDGSMRLEDMDRYIIETTLKRHGYNVTAAARALGTTRNTLRYRIQKYGLQSH